MTDKEKVELQLRRDKFIADAADRVHLRMLEPYVEEVHDLLVYQRMNANGVRMFDIPRLLREAVKRAVPK